jgi:hypothetical protein
MGADPEIAKRQTINLESFVTCMFRCSNSWRQSYEEILVSSFVDYASAGGS